MLKLAWVADRIMSRTLTTRSSSLSEELTPILEREGSQREFALSAWIEQGGLSSFYNDLNDEQANRSLDLLSQIRDHPTVARSIENFDVSIILTCPGVTDPATVRRIIELGFPLGRSLTIYAIHKFVKNRVDRQAIIAAALVYEHDIPTWLIDAAFPK